MIIERDSTVNVRWVSFQDKPDRFLISYETPVCYFDGEKWFKTKTQWSASTMNNHIPRACSWNTPSMLQSEINAKFKELTGLDKLVATKSMKRATPLIDTSNINPDKFTKSGNKNMVVPIGEEVFEVRYKLQQNRRRHDEQFFEESIRRMAKKMAGNHLKWTDFGMFDDRIDGNWLIHYENGAAMDDEKWNLSANDEYMLKAFTNREEEGENWIRFTAHGFYGDLQGFAVRVYDDEGRITDMFDQWWQYQKVIHHSGCLDWHRAQEMDEQNNKRQLSYELESAGLEDKLEEVYAKFKNKNDVWHSEKIEMMLLKMKLIEKETVSE